MVGGRLDAQEKGDEAMKRIFSWLFAGSLVITAGAAADEPLPTPPLPTSPTPSSAPMNLPPMNSVAGDVSPPSTAPAESPFEVVVLALKNDWQAMRYHKTSGESWYTLKGDWKAVPEAGDDKPPDGDYKLFLAATGDNDFVALRLERKSGRSWRLAALKWIEMKVLGGEPELPQPQQPPLPLPAPGDAGGAN
jgi:hypothetical protein